ncbi:leucine-rich repeat domain-containing protein [Isobaculum melis]|uniref:Leucine-rich repeat (LRR) protein n=1 Tax=Isobaculum melis TaxID=142588 RepID=A0A1H9UKX3_9LACT|nr:leucine-rich repeat domain-containing protein [Isobaculum melis]SES10012.1 Leucine-rich repeat (LRR) protein [Isobaculum melis]
MKKWHKNISILLALIILFVIGLKATELLANYEVVSDLSIESEQQEISIDESFNLKIKSANAEDKRVLLPLPANVDYESSGVEHGSVVFDQENHQLMIDWYDTTTENRYVTVTMKIEEEGTYPFQAVSQRQEKAVQSQPIELTVTLPVEEEQVTEEPQAEEAQTEVVPSNDNEELSESQPVPATEEIPVHKDAEQAPENKALKTDARIGQPINVVFPDTIFASYIANQLKKNVTDPITQADVDKTTTLDQNQAFRGIESLEGIDIFSQLTALKLTNLKITDIPEAVLNLTKLKSLSLHSSQAMTITENIDCLSELTYLNLFNVDILPETIGNLVSLTYLEVRGTQLTSIPGEIGKLNKLQTLNINGTGLTSLPPELGNLVSLKILNLSQNKLTALPSELGNLSALQTLEARLNQLTSLPAELGNLSSLTKLDFYHNKISTIPATLGNLNNLKELILSSNQLTSIPDTLGNLNNLKELILFSNQLTSIPATLGNLNSITKLDFNWNKIPTVPATLGKLSTLLILTLRGNLLEIVPIELGNLSSLTNLNLSDNQLIAIPATLGKLSNLLFLDLGKNQLTILPTELGNLSNLQSLSLDSNQLTSVPAELGNLSNLQRLSLYSNQLTTVPDSYMQLTSLLEWSLQNNKGLESLPENIGNLTKLKKLELYDTSLISLPESLGNLSELVDLTIYNTKLTKLPESIGNLTKLKNLNLTKTALTSLPESIGKLKNNSMVYGINFKNTYLPSDTVAQLKARFPTLKIVDGAKVFSKLTMNDSTTSVKVDIDEYEEWSNLIKSETLMSYLEKEHQHTTHHYLLDEYSDKQGNPINIEDYVKDGKILKTGTIHAKIRAGGTGLFPNNSNNAITDDTIEIEFYKRKLTFTSIPTTVSFGTDVAISANEKTYPLQAIGQPLAVQDNRKMKSTWTVSAKMTKELTSESNHVLTDSLLYRLNGNQFYLNTSSINLFSQQNTDDDPFAISDTWMKDEQNGLFLNIKAGQAFAETYTGTIEWDLQDVPSNSE